MNFISKYFEYIIIFFILSSTLLPDYYYSFFIIFSFTFLYFVKQAFTRVAASNIILTISALIFFVIPALIFVQINRVSWIIFTTFTIAAIAMYMRQITIKVSRLLIYLIFSFYIVLVYYYADDKLSYSILFLGDHSSNWITSTLLILTACYSYFKYSEFGRFSFLLPLSLLILSIILTGRSGIGFSSILILVNFIYYFISKGLNLKNTFYIAFGFAVGVFLFMWVDFYGFLVENTRIVHGFHLGLRGDLFDEYIDNLDGVSLIFGGSYPNTINFKSMLDNPHNSYLRLHYTFGIFSLFAILILILYSVRKDCLHSFRFRRYEIYYKYSIVLILMLRAYYDVILFPSVFDIFFFALIFSGNRPSSSKLIPAVSKYKI